ncbi:helix-turn-helix transcriptional regulator [Psychrobacillus sp. MER TA 171]|uniref:helix-turn-helix domain-containing protein n=1 Tax=Psychrobacillus sp. MER TA 171 TaxID=2939577 RepID=UPI00203C3E8C|nr:helix-turn-helix transcriptional regulator [Psychrobacillus sp. MER TA 171]MCM3359818.1 helix-turn-helix transcriptional regulator [Psychrobacillus sp. MER TA 171]
MYLKSRLKILLAERDMNQKDLADKTGLTTRLISEIANNKVKMYPKEALEKIMVALEIKDLSELLKSVEDEETDN